MTSRLRPVLPSLLLSLCPAALGCGADDDTAADVAADVADTGDAADMDGDAGGEDATNDTDSGALCSTWEVAFDATEYGAFMSVWGRGPDDVWTVGGQPDLGESTPDGVAFHYDGDRWSEVELPDGGMLNWVHGTETSTWMAGEGARVLRLEGTEVVDTFQAPTDADFWGIWASADDDVWAVGGLPRDPDGVPVMFHYDGDDWTEVTLPGNDTGARSLFKIWGADADHLFAVGARGLVLGRTDGEWTAWDTGVAEDLISLWGRGADDVIVAGGRAMGTIGRFDGSDWTFSTLDRVSGLNGVWMAADGTAIVDGANGRILRLESDSLEFEDLESPTSDLLHGTWALDGGPCFAVGGTLLAPPPYEGAVLIAH